MKLERLFTIAAFLVASTAWPAASFPYPAISLQHLFADKDCETVPKLLGDWATQGDLSGLWAIHTSKDGKYRLIQKVGQSTSSDREAFDICVAHLGGYLFFDATFQRVQADGETAVFTEDDLWIPLHLIGRLEVKDDALQFLLLADDWLQDELKSGRLHLTSTQDDEGNYLLAAPSKELKEFAAHFAADSRAFSYAEDFELVPQVVQPASIESRIQRLESSSSSLTPLIVLPCSSGLCLAALRVPHLRAFRAQFQDFGRGRHLACGHCPPRASVELRRLFEVVREEHF